MAIRKELLGERHPDYLISLYNLGGLLKDQGDLSRARPLLERAVAQWEQSLGARHSAYLRSLTVLATLLQAQGDMVQAVRHVEQALDRAQEFLTTSLPTLSERQRIELLTSTQYVLATFLSLTAGSTERDEAVYRRLLFWKGLAGTDAAARRLIAATPEIRSNVLELNQVRAELNSLTYARIAPERRQQQERQLSEVRERRERLESELARASGWKPDAPHPRGCRRPA